MKFSSFSTNLEFMNRIPSWLKNRYVLTLVVFLSYMLFFNDADVFSVYKSHAEVNKIQEEIDWYRANTKECKERLDKLEQGGFELERLAREKHFLKRENEDVFIVKVSDPE
ncbi:MAG: septum formation initiator family protein [Flavobacteriales bacterium]